MLEEHDDPFGRSFEKFKDEFEREVLQLLDEYGLKLGLKDICSKIFGKNVKELLRKGENSGLKWNLRQWKFMVVKLKGLNTTYQKSSSKCSKLGTTLLMGSEAS